MSCIAVESKEEDSNKKSYRSVSNFMENMTVNGPYLTDNKSFEKYEKTLADLWKFYEGCYAIADFVIA